MGSLDQLPNNEFDHVFKVNLRSLFWSLKYESAAMKTHGGTIVNCGSAASVVGAAGFATYSATMHALVGLTKSSAIDNAPLGIRINAVLPGPIETEIWNPHQTGEEMKEAFGGATPIGRIGQPSEIAGPVIFLLSDKSSYMIGSCLAVDGGYAIQ